MRQITFLLLFFSLQVFAQKSEILLIDSLPTDGTSRDNREGVLLDKGWKYQTGDNPDWAKPEFDDSAWASIDPTKEIVALPQIFNAQIKWLRLDFEIKNKLPNPLGIAINQAGASQIYLNGRLIHEFGHFDTDSNKVKAYDPLQTPIYLPADSVGKYHLAVRYALQPNIRYTHVYRLTKNCLFNATLLDLVPTLHAQTKFRVYYKGIDIFILGVCFMLFMLHLAFYLYQKSNKTYLILAVYLLCTTIIRTFKIIGQNENFVEDRYYSLNISNWLLSVSVICLATVYYRIAKERFDRYYYALIVYYIVYGIVSSSTYGFQWQTLMLLIGSIFSFVVLVRLTRIGIKKGMKGFVTMVVAISFAVFGLVCITTSFLFLNYGITPTGHNVLEYGISPYLIDAIFNLGSIAIPIGLSLFMGIQGNETNKALNKQLIENEQLKSEAIELEQEKQQILANQNETLEKQVAERTAELHQSLEVLKATQNQLIQSEKLANLGELTAGISHEIQNPLNFVTNFSELSVDIVKDLQEEMQRPDMDKSYIEELFTDLASNQEKIKHHGKRASSIVKGMLEHSRESTGVRELTDINKLADEYLRLSYHGLRAKDKSFNADFKTEFQDTLPKIKVIPQDLGRVLLNLINNAFYAVNERKKNISAKNVGEVSNLADVKTYQPTVTVSTQQIGNQIIIKVKDNGIGIPEAVKAKVFQPFFTTKPTGSGTGLGLSLSYDIVAKGHGGSLEVVSTEGVGTEFTITLPLNYLQS